MILVEIQNSWQLDLVRLYKSRGDFKKYYWNLVIAEVFGKSGSKGLRQDLTIFFNDNHFCNVDNLDYKNLHAFFRNFFRTVVFVSDNPYDAALDPDYFTWLFDNKSLTDIANQLTERQLFYDMCLQQDVSLPDVPKKMFGLHLLRPDVHRLGLLVALHRKGLLEHVDVRLGFRSEEFGNPEYRRSSNIDTVCFEFDICHRDLFDLIDNQPMGDRINFQDNAAYRGIDHIRQDSKKNIYHTKFAIELVCASSIHDHVFDQGEKILRPMILRQPFIWLASANSLRILKNEGTDIFDNIWDVSWDRYTEGWLPTKIDEVVKTCEFILTNFTIESVKEATRPGVENNFDMIEHTLGNSKLSADKWERFPHCSQIIHDMLLAIDNNSDR
jgi:hypothetical protein